MASSNKPRLVKDYDKLPLDIQGQIKLNYPQGFAGSLITYIDAKGKVVSALPYETDDFYYLVRMTLSEAYDIIENDEDFDDEDFDDEDFDDEDFDDDDLDDIFDDDDDEDEEDFDDEIL